MKAQVELEGVGVRLGDKQILHGIDLSVDSGEFIGLIGPNGAGKSTLLRTINAVLTPMTGSVRIGDVDIHRCSARTASRLVATVPQDTTIAFDFSVREVVRMGRTPYRQRFTNTDPDSTPIVTAAMERTQTTGLANRPMGAISGGERQRVILARSIAQDTPVLLLDEPTANLDINHQIRTFEMVRDLVDAERKTVIAAVHDLNLAAHYCDSLVLLADSTIVTRGVPENVLTESNLDEAFETTAAVTHHPVTGSVYVSALPEKSSRLRECTVHVIGGGGTASRILYVLWAAGFELTVGALNEGDTDLETARLLGIDSITVAPFTPIDDRTATSVRRAIESADVTVLSDIEIGEANRANLESARSSSSVVIVEKRPIARRNFAGDGVESLYHRIRADAVVIDEDEIVRGVELAHPETEPGDGRRIPPSPEIEHQSTND